MCGGLSDLHLGLSQSYVCGLVFFRFGVSESYVSG